MKKEYLILMAVIVLAGSYLFLHKENQNSFKMPEIQKIDTSKITGITIEKIKENIELTKKGKNWVLTDDKFPADSTLVQDMLDTFKTFKLTTLVSDKNDLLRYKLDKKQRVNVKLLENDKTFFEFSIGKPAPSFNHTFVMLADKKKIYHAKGNFRSDFNKSMDDFRDKKILQFNEKSIKLISIEKNQISNTFILKEEKGKNKKASSSWISKEGTPVDEKNISDLLSTLSFLKCETYLVNYTKKSLKTKVGTIRLENKNKMELTIYKDDKQENLIGTSSMNDYIFSLDESDGKKIISDVEKLLGITADLDKKS
jgi:hypothetical protein